MMPYPYYPQNYNQNFSQNLTQSIPGRIVADQNEIMANEVPMDGSVAVFPSKNLDKVYVKQWSANGSITTRIYSLEQPYLPVDSTNTRLTELDGKIGAITARMDDLESRLSKRKEGKE